MSETQTTPVSAPLPTDDKLQVFATVLQQNLFDLFNYAHTHTPTNVVPTNTQGNVGDISIVQIGTSYYLYAKVSKTLWKRVLLS